MTVCVTIRMRRLEYRSAMTPPHKLKSRSGKNCNPVVMPSAVPLLWVSSSTSQSCATRCIQLPVFDTTWPAAKSR